MKLKPGQRFTYHGYDGRKLGAFTVNSVDAYGAGVVEITTDNGRPDSVPGADAQRCIQRRWWRPLEEATDPSEPGRQAAAAAVDNDPNHTATCKHCQREIEHAGDTNPLSQGVSQHGQVIDADRCQGCSTLTNAQYCAVCKAEGLHQ